MVVSFSLAALLHVSGGSTPDIHIVDSHVKCLLGGVAGDKWVDVDHASASLRGGERYRVVTGDGRETEAAGGKPESAGEACSGTVTVPLQPSVEAAFVATTGKRSLLPRKALDVTRTKRTYAALLTASLANKRVRVGQDDIRRLWRVDVDGDGKDEIVAVLRNFSLESEAASDARSFSAVVVRRISKGKVVTIPIEFEQGAREGGLSELEVPFLVDLDGDGTLEIVIHGRYLQGVFTTVYSWRKNRFERVLSCSCGA